MASKNTTEKLKHIISIAPHLGCEEDNCQCTSWKKRTGVPPDFHCATCGHGLPRHGDIIHFPMEQLAALGRFAKQIDYAVSQAQQASDQEHKRANIERAQKLRRDLRELHASFVESSRTNTKPVPTSPPFESPNFEKIMSNFVIYKYEDRYAEAKKRAIDKLHWTLISCANKMILPEPTERSSKIIDLAAYELYHPLWVTHCKPNISSTSREDTKVKTLKTMEKVKSTKPLLSNSFGRLFIRSFLPLLQDVLMNQYQLTREMENFAPNFFRDLAEELHNSQSMVCLDDFDEAIVHVQRIQRQLNLEAADKEDITDAGQKYQPAFAPLKRKNDYLRELAPDAEVHYAKFRAGEIDTDASQRDNPTIPHPMPVNKDKDGDVDMEDPLHDNPIEARDTLAKNEEQQGVLTSRIISNDNTPETMILLIRVRNIFAHQLPKMPKEYITRLVLDKHHRSLLLIKHNTVVGGICFHPFPEFGFIEIAFLAITADEQVKGYGTHLMNHLKTKMQAEHYYYFVTYADNFAIGYFKKQGFTKYVTMPREWWAGLIKDYDGGTIMECHIHPTIDFHGLSDIIKQQRAAIHTKVKEYCNSHVRRNGIQIFKKNGTNRLTPDQVPGIDECREPEIVKQSFPTDEYVEGLHTLFQSIINGLLKLPDIWPFEKPVSKEEVPDYYDVIKVPVDLEMVQQRLDTKCYYITEHIFFADLRRMLENCKLYNKEDTYYYQHAVSVEKALCDRGWEKYFRKKN